MYRKISSGVDTLVNQFIEEMMEFPRKDMTQVKSKVESKFLHQAYEDVSSARSFWEVDDTIRKTELYSALQNAGGNRILAGILASNLAEVIINTKDRLREDEVKEGYFVPMSIHDTTWSEVYKLGLY